MRTSAFFGPWDCYNFVALALDALGRGSPFAAASDVTISPTYVPDLVHCCLDLIIDRECGVWHLTNGTPVTWSQLAGKAAQLAGIDASHLVERRAGQCQHIAARPRYSVLGSSRGVLLPALDNALMRFLDARAHTDTVEDLLYATDVH